MILSWTGISVDEKIMCVSHLSMWAIYQVFRVELYPQKLTHSVVIYSDLTVEFTFDRPNFILAHKSVPKEHRYEERKILNFQEKSFEVWRNEIAHPFVDMFVEIQLKNLRKEKGREKWDLRQGEGFPKMNHDLL